MSFVNRTTELALLRAEDPDPVYVICAREEVTGELPPETLVVTADDIFG